MKTKSLITCGAIAAWAAVAGCATEVREFPGNPGGGGSGATASASSTGAGGMTSSSAASTSGAGGDGGVGPECSEPTCDDHDECTTDGCVGDTCTHDAVIVDDGDACTSDSCDPATGVAHVAVPTDDGDACTTDSCDAATGVAHMDVDVDDGDACTADACDPLGGISHTPVPFDDLDACTTDSCDPALGPVHKAISCDDANACTIDSCNPANGCNHGPLCAANETCNNGLCSPIVGTPKIFVTSSNGSVGFYEYNVATNTWAIRPSPPAVTYAQLTTDGSSVFLSGADNKIYKYAPASQTWSNVQLGPGAESSQPIALFKYANGTFYFAKDGNSTVRWSANAGPWNTVNVPQNPSCAGTYDAASGNIYMRAYNNMGVIVFSTASKSVIQSWPSPASVGENSRTGSFYKGFFYERDLSSPIHKMSMANGMLVATNVTPLESHTASDVNPANGDIYIGPYSPTGTAFQVYNANTNVLKSLAPMPMSVTNHSTIVFVAAP